MEANKISVIVPVYNTEKYLKKCIESILAQSFSNFELLLINDGSTDHSSGICHQYEKDSRVRIYDRKNEGVSKTRNFGMSEAKGEYILFVDSDDYIEPDMFEILWRALIENKADCAMCGLIHETEKTSRRFPQTRIQKVIHGREAVRETLLNWIATVGPVCKLFSKAVLTEKKFPEDLTIGEDAIFVVSALLAADKVAMDMKACYHYNHREASLTSSDFSKRDLELVTAYQRIGRMLRDNAYGMEKESEFRLIWAHFHVFDKAILSKPKKWKENFAPCQEIIVWLRKSTGTILRNPYVGKKRKLSMCVLFFSRNMYAFIIRYFLSH